MNGTPEYLITAALSYMAGSLPFALICGKLLKGIDIREEGSGNAGATNVYRVLGAPAAAAVLLLDLLKGFLPVMLLMNRHSAGEDPYLTGVISVLFLILGHSFPLFAGFRGGKGVAVGAGGITALLPLSAPFCLGVFLLTLTLTRTVSLASLAAAWSLPLTYLAGSVIGLFPSSPVLLTFFFITAPGITVLHIKNIRRLIRGEEPRITLKP